MLSCAVDESVVCQVYDLERQYEDKALDELPGPYGASNDEWNNLGIRLDNFVSTLQLGRKDYPEVNRCLGQLQTMLSEAATPDCIDRNDKYLKQFGGIFGDQAEADLLPLF